MLNLFINIEKYKINKTDKKFSLLFFGVDYIIQYMHEPNKTDAFAWAFQSQPNPSTLVHFKSLAVAAIRNL